MLEYDESFFPAVQETFLNFNEASKVVFAFAATAHLDESVVVSFVNVLKKLVEFLILKIYLSI